MAEEKWPCFHQGCNNNFLTNHWRAHVERCGGNVHQECSAQLQGGCLAKFFNLASTGQLPRTRRAISQVWQSFQSMIQAATVGDAAQVNSDIQMAQVADSSTVHLVIAVSNSLDHQVICLPGLPCEHRSAICSCPLTDVLVRVHTGFASATVPHSSAVSICDRQARPHQTLPGRSRISHAVRAFV